MSMTRGNVVDVIIGYEAVDIAAAATCAAAFEREGWLVFRSDGATSQRPNARAYVVIWSEESIGSARLARESRAPLENKQLLQLLVQPRKAADAPSTGRQNVIEPPEPFCFYQGLPLAHADADGSERAVDVFAYSWSAGQRMLAELARLGGLERPCDDWNARIVFSRFQFESKEAFTISEYSASDGRLLRRFNLYGGGFLEQPYRTATGNRWCVVTQRDGEVATEVVVDNPEELVDLPRRPRWWHRLRQR